jgi:adenylate cyclase
VNIGPRKWEIDKFHGMNEGLVLGEVELEREGEEVERPPWVVKEVSDDPRFYNVNLAQHPYQSWAGNA